MRQLNRNFRATAIAAALMSAAAEATAGGTGVTAETKPVLTRAEKQAAQVLVLTKRIEADTAKLAELRNDIETASRLDGVEAGSAIVARIGRAETSKEVPARVLGVKEDEATGSRRYKIAYGEGFDADTAVIQASQIVSVIVEGGAPAADAVVEPVAESNVAYTEVSRDAYDRPVNVYGQVIADLPAQA
jgi:hypothetical protein